MNEDYLRLESLVQKVVSPYLGTHGLYSGDGTEGHCCVLGKISCTSLHQERVLPVFVFDIS